MQMHMLLSILLLLIHMCTLCQHCDNIMLTFPKSPDEQMILKIVLPVVVCIVVVLFLFGYRVWRRRGESCPNAKKETPMEKTSSFTLQTYDLERPPSSEDSAGQNIDYCKERQQQLYTVTATGCYDLVSPSHGAQQHTVESSPAVTQPRRRLGFENQRWWW
jgi:hypothetical protein